MFYFNKLLLFHTISHSLFLSPYLITHTRQPSSDFHVRMFRYGKGRELLRQPLHDLLYGDDAGIVRGVFRWEIGDGDHLLVVEHLLELFVLLDDTGIVLVLEPVATPLLQLGIELAV